MRTKAIAMIGGGVLILAQAWPSVAQPAHPHERSGAPLMPHLLSVLHQLELSAEQQSALRSLQDEVCAKRPARGIKGSGAGARVERAEARRQELVLSLQAGETTVLEVLDRRTQQFERKRAQREQHVGALRALLVSLDSAQSQALNQGLSASLAAGGWPALPACGGAS